MLTVFRRLAAGPTLRSGTSAPYRSLVEVDGEPHVVRTDLTGPVRGDVKARRGALLVLAQLTDLHVTDVESPARFEYLNRFASDPRYRELLTMQRPQESLNTHAVDAMIRAVNAIEAGPVTGSPVDLVAMTGDAIDNAQSNEWSNFKALFEGGVVKAGSGGPHVESVQSAGWPDEQFWKPDGGAQGHDDFRVRYGFPTVPGLLDRALRPFQAGGLRPPWIACRGNHEFLCQGVGVVTPEMARAYVEGRKPVGLPDRFDPNTALDLFTTRPQAYMDAPTIAVTPDPGRAPAHISTPRNLVRDTGKVRLITLDTSCPAGGADGCIDRQQLDWLEERLAEAHATYVGRDGETVRTGNDNRLVVVLSHHPLFTIRNPRLADAVAADEVRRTLHRFPNVVLWLNGHIHMNMVQPHASRAGIAVGFWEVTTSSIVDWPCQGRLVEIFYAGGGRLGIACTMIDHAGAAEPGAGVTGDELAGLHRQLAANDPFAGLASPRAGSEADRNVVLLLPAPFELRQ